MADAFQATKTGKNMTINPKPLKIGVPLLVMPFKKDHIQDIIFVYICSDLQAPH